MSSRNPSGHPARFSDKLLPIFSSMLPYSGKLLDPFGGTGEKLAFLLDPEVFAGEVISNELEPYWASFTPEGITSIVGDARDLPFDEESIDCALSSPCYGNRMADAHTPSPEDTSKRNTYTHRMMAATGQKLLPGNAGAMQWGPDYRKLHLHAWIELWRVLKPWKKNRRDQGIFVLNCKDHIRGGERMRVTQWHLDTLERIGFRIEEHQRVKLGGNRQGENHSVRVATESVVKLRRVG